jgi:hypothetical protein
MSNLEPNITEEDSGATVPPPLSTDNPSGAVQDSATAEVIALPVRVSTMGGPLKEFDHRPDRTVGDYLQLAGIQVGDDQQVTVSGNNVVVMHTVPSPGAAIVCYR